MRFKIQNKAELILIVSFFLLHLAGLSYSQNTGESLFDIQVMLSLLVFPVMFIGANELYRQKIKYILLSFIAGNVLASLICLGHSFYLLFWWDATFQYFTYQDLSILIHPSYFAMYLCFAIASIFEMLDSTDTKRKKILFIALIVFFSGIIYLLSSKAGLIALSITLFFFVFRLLKKLRNGIFVWLSGTALMIILSFTILFNARFGPLKDVVENFFFHSGSMSKVANESNSVRIKIIESSVKIIKENFWIGVGNGDAKEALMNQYKLHHITMAEEKKLNAHNQFLQTFIETGVIGFILLILVFAISLIRSIIKKNILLTIFFITTGINFLFESMLETQAGTVFFGFFFALLNFIPLKNSSVQNV